MWFHHQNKSSNKSSFCTLYPLNASGGHKCENVTSMEMYFWDHESVLSCMFHLSGADSSGELHFLRSTFTVFYLDRVCVVCRFSQSSKTILPPITFVEFPNVQYIFSPYSRRFSASSCVWLDSFQRCVFVVVFYCTFRWLSFPTCLALLGFCAAFFADVGARVPCSVDPGAVLFGPQVLL